MGNVSRVCTVLYSCHIAPRIAYRTVYSTRGTGEVPSFDGITSSIQPADGGTARFGVMTDTFFSLASTYRPAQVRIYSRWKGGKKKKGK